MVDYLAALGRKVLHGFHLSVVIVLSAEHHIFRDLAAVDEPIAPEPWQLYKKAKRPDADHICMMYTPNSRNVVCDADSASCIAALLLPSALITMSLDDGHP